MFDSNPSNMKFLFISDIPTSQSFLCGFSIIFGAQVICLLGLITEILLTLLVWANYESVIFILLLVLSIVKCLVFITTLVGTFMKSFSVCHFGNFLLQMLLYMFAILQLIILIAVWFGWVHLENEGQTYLLDGLAVFSGFILYLITVLLNLYYCYIIYSMTKELGSGNLILNQSGFGEISRSNTAMSNKGYNPPIYTQPTVGEQGSSFLPINEGNDSFRKDSDMDLGSSRRRSNARVSHSDEKIVLCDPSDLSFAQFSQNTIVDDSTLPSGLKVPSGREGRVWRIIGSEILLI
jgi:hypothetical protein